MDNSEASDRFKGIKRIFTYFLLLALLIGQASFLNFLDIKPTEANASTTWTKGNSGNALDPLYPTETVDSSADTGYQSSIALDGSGNPRIVYRDNENGYLKYASYSGSAWTISNISSAGQSGYSPSLVLDGSGNPRVSYYKSDSEDLAYASYNGAVWSSTTIDSTGDVGSSPSLDLDSSGNPKISYFDYTNRNLKYASYNGAAWSVSTIDSVGDVGLYTSLKLNDSGNPRIAYYDYTNYDLKYASFDGAIWSISTVDSAGYTGKYPSLALDSGGNPKISYYEGDYHLKYASYNGVSWDVSIIDSLVIAFAASYISLKLDSNNYPHISYYDDNLDLGYASYNGTSWSTVKIDTVGALGQDTSMALDGNDIPHISYLDSTNDTLKYVEINPGSTSYPRITYNGIIYEMWTERNGGNNYYAYSANGTSWYDFQQIEDASGNNFNAHEASIVKDGATYKMWYNSGGTKYRTSADGIVWSAETPCVFDLTKAWDTDRVTPFVVKDGATYKMYYNANEGNGSYYIAYATSVDGINWVEPQNLGQVQDESLSDQNNLVLKQGSVGAWDGYQAGEALYSVHVLKNALNTYEMWYGGNTSGPSSYKIGYATSSNGISWTKSASNPLLAGSAGKWDETGVIYPSVAVEDDGSYRMWYTNNWNGGVGFATAADDSSDSTPPTVTNVTATTANGYYNAGDTINVTVQFNEVVNVTGTPRIELETGATNRYANYSTGSGSDTLTFAYVVQAGDASVDLDYVATGSLTQNGGTIKDAALNDATLTLVTPGVAGSLGANKAIYIDTVNPLTPGAFYDGTDAIDDVWTTSLTTLSANWTAANDWESGIQKYQYSIGTTAGATNVVGWTDNALSTSFNLGGLTLSDHAIYFTNIRAVDNAGNTGDAVSTNGITVQASEPTSTPVMSQYYNGTSWSNIISGTAFDGYSDIASVSMTVRRSSDSKYWTGTGDVWQNDEIWVSTIYVAGTWTKAFSYVSNGVSYSVQSKATNNATVIQTTLGTDSFIYDTTPPASSAVMNEMYTTGDWANLSGTASDTASSVTTVQASLMRSSDSKYWDGDSWETAQTWLSVTGTTSWSYAIPSSNLNNGVIYTVFVKATDGANNTAFGTSDQFMFNNMNWQQYRLNALPGSSNTSFSSVMKDGSTYKTWYVANTSVYYAYSTNGVTWEAGSPDNNGVNQPIFSGTPSTWDYFGVVEPWVVKDGSTYKMWYSGSNGIDVKIGYATSADGISWTKSGSNPIISNGVGGSWDSISVRRPIVLKEGATYKMWYNGTQDENTGFNIGYATSSDGISWTKYGSAPVFSRGTNPDWDYSNVWSASIIKRGTEYEMYYAGNSNNNHHKIGYAYSNDGISWTKYEDNPVMSNGAGGSWNDERLSYPIVMLDGTIYKMWYTGNDGALNRVGYATMDAPADSTPPISTPTITNEFYSSNGLWTNDYTISGSATDMWGIERVELTIKRNSDNKYWTGSAWSASETWVNAVDWSGNGYLTWRYTLNSSNLSDSVGYTITSKSTDGSGVVSGVTESSLNLDSFTLDESDASSTITQINAASPEDYYNSAGLPVTLAGTASDATSGVNSSRLAIKRSTDNYYWRISLSQWVPEERWDQVTGTTSWTYSPVDEDLLTSMRSLGDGVVYSIYSASIDNVDNNYDLLTSNVITFIYDNTSPTAGSVNDGVSTDIDSITSASELSANWSGFADLLSGIASYQYSIGSSAGQIDTLGWTTNGSATSVTKSGLSLSRDQIYYVNVRALDAAGNVGLTASSDGQMVVDLTPPVINLSSYPSSSISSLTPNFQGTVTDAMSNISSIEYKIDSGSWTSISAVDGTFDEKTEEFNFNTSNLSEGSHVIYIRVTDEKLNVTSATDYSTKSFTISLAVLADTTTQTPATTVATTVVSGSTNASTDDLNNNAPVVSNEVSTTSDAQVASNEPVSIASSSEGTGFLVSMKNLGSKILSNFSKLKENKTFDNAQQTANYVVIAIPVINFALIQFANDPIFRALQVLLSNILLWLSPRRKKYSWGRVIDSQTGEPVTLATVRIFDKEKNKLLESQLTDSQGRFGFLVVPGSYYLDIINNNYAFPSQINNSSYHGQALEVKDAQMLALDVSVDLKIAKISNRIKTFNMFQNILNIIKWPLLIWGTFSVIMYYLLSHNTYNLVMLVLYAIIWLIEIYYLFSTVKSIGKVSDAQSSNGLDLAIVRLFNNDSGKLVNTRVTNKLGSYSVLANEGNYYLTALKQGYDLQKTDVKKIDKNDVVSENIELRKFNV
jgi:predicted GH43/DUF377 family glycosyl hydrolase